MSERKITVEDAAIFRIQAMQEITLKLLCQFLADQKNLKVDEVLIAAKTDIDLLTRSLISMHSRLSDENPSTN